MGIMKTASPAIRNRGKVLTRLFVALVQGTADFEAVKPFRESEPAKQALGLDTALSVETVLTTTGEQHTQEPAHRFAGELQGQVVDTDSGSILSTIDCRLRTPYYKLLPGLLGPVLFVVFVVFAPSNPRFVPGRTGGCFSFLCVYPADSIVQNP